MSPDDLFICLLYMELNQVQVFTFIVYDLQHYVPKVFE